MSSVAPGEVEVDRCRTCGAALWRAFEDAGTGKSAGG